MGIAEGNLEMLFIHENARGKGIGKQLILEGMHRLGVQKVDVNEQNSQAVGFYEHMGFKTHKRSALDGQGKPYPILHMEI